MHRLLALVLSAVAPLAALDDGLARTPPMGWNSWNCFQGNFDEEKLRGIAKALIDTGLRDAGYVWLNCDDHVFQYETRGDLGTRRLVRDDQGRPQLRTDRWKTPLPELSAWVKAQGLSFGQYARPHELYGTASEDARRFAALGVGYLKIDMHPDWMYDPLCADLRAAGPLQILSIHQKQAQADSFAMCHVWRTSEDIVPTWDSILKCHETVVGRECLAGPGGWNDPDMLQIGNGALTLEQNRSHLALWAMTAAPLLIGCDLRSTKPEIIAILTNRDVIAVNQDRLGVSGVPVRRSKEVDVWMRPLADADGARQRRAVLILNRSGAPQRTAVTWAELGLSGAPTAQRDLHAHADVPVAADGISAELPAHGACFVVLAGAALKPATDTTLAALAPAYPRPGKAIDRWAAAAAQVQGDALVLGYPDQITGSTLAAWRIDGRYARAELTLAVRDGGKPSSAFTKAEREIPPLGGGNTTTEPARDRLRFEVWCDLKRVWQGEPLAAGGEATAAIDLTGVHHLIIRAVRGSVYLQHRPVLRGTLATAR